VTKPGRYNVYVAERNHRAVRITEGLRHGVHIRAIDVQSSDWAYTIGGEDDGLLSVRLGLGYAKGFANELERQYPS
jgi:hypothetical protein